MRRVRRRSAFGSSVRPALGLGGIVVFALGLGAAVGGRARHGAGRVDDERSLLAAAIANLEKQSAKLAGQADPSCPQDFAALESGGPLRLSLFYGYDEHEGRVRDRVHARAMSYVLTRPCRDRLSTCGFTVVASSASTESLTRTIGGRGVEVNLFTTSLPDEAAEAAGPLSARREQERLSRAVKERFYRELVASDVVFYMGHSRLGGSIGFDDQTGVTTLVDSVLRRPLRPVLDALRRRPTRLRMLGMFSCESARYFGREFREANPALALILTTGDIRYAPAEQASLGALEAVLSKNCGSAVRESLVSATEPDPTMTYLVRGR